MTTQTGVSMLMLAVPALIFLSALVSRSAPRWRFTQYTNAAALAISVAVAALVLSKSLAAGGDWHPWLWLNQSPVAPVLLLLVTFLGTIIVRYSRNYLAGEPHQARYLAMLQFTLGAVVTVLLSNHLLVFLLAWVLISLGLNELLLFYRDRPRATLAAHKKFLFARLGEIFLAVAFALLYTHHGTWTISEIVAAYPTDGLSGIEQLAVMCLAATALLKCAQLPAHGWLMQVMEAPTPVSALLHAGVVNLGGYLLLLFAPLLVQATAAQWLLLAVAGPSMVVAGLVMMTRVSIKVKLAWSTCAQMALMLVECALGMFELALLHLIAHSCYKAYSFLNSGSVVTQSVARRLAPATAPHPRAWLASGLAASALVMVLVWALGAQGALSPWLLMAAAITVLLAERSSTAWAPALVSAVPPALLLLAAYGLQKIGAGQLMAPMPASAGVVADGWVITLVAVLFAAYHVLRYHPHSALARRLSVALFAGFYLDEWATRNTLRLWPTKLPARKNAKQLCMLQEEVSQ